MPQSIREVMTPSPTVLDASATVAQAARAMRDQSVGDVLVERDGSLCGIVTDRDLVVRALADGSDAGDMPLGDICSRDLVVLAPTDSVDDAVTLMRERGLRRIPVCDGPQPVGIVSIGDLALERDPRSALAGISASPANT